MSVKVNFKCFYSSVRLFILNYTHKTHTYTHITEISRPHPRSLKKKKNPKLMKLKQGSSVLGIT